MNIIYRITEIFNEMNSRSSIPIIVKYHELSRMHLNQADHCIPMETIVSERNSFRMSSFEKWQSIHNDRLSCPYADKTTTQTVIYEDKKSLKPSDETVSAFFVVSINILRCLCLFDPKVPPKMAFSVNKCVCVYRYIYVNINTSGHTHTIEIIFFLFVPFYHSAGNISKAIWPYHYV